MAGETDTAVATETAADVNAETRPAADKAADAVTNSADERIAAATKVLQDKGIMPTGDDRRASANASQAEAPKLTQRQRELADELGLSADDLKDPVAVKYLDSLAKKADRHMVKLGEKSRELDEALAAAKTNTTPKGKEVVPDEDDDEAGDESTPPKARRDDDTPIDVNELFDAFGSPDPELFPQYLTRVDKHIERQNTIIEQLLQERESDQWENYFDGLDSQVYPAFGTGRTENLPPNSPERAAREAFQKDVKLYINGAKFAKQPISLREAQRRMTPAPDPNGIVEAERQRLQNDLARQRSGSLVRARSGGGMGNLTPQEARVKQAEQHPSVQKFMH